MSLEHKWMLHCIPTTHSLSILTPKGNIFFVCHINGITRTHIISINIIGTLLSLLRVSLFFLSYDPLMCVLLRIPNTFMWVLSTERVSKTLIVVEGTEHIRGCWVMTASNVLSYTVSRYIPLISYLDITFLFLSRIQQIKVFWKGDFKLYAMVWCISAETLPGAQNTGWKTQEQKQLYLKPSTMITVYNHLFSCTVVCVCFVPLVHMHDSRVECQ